MDILYRRRRATVADVMQDMTGSLSYSTVRTQLRVLQHKGHVRHDEEGLRYVYSPRVPRGTARRSALTNLRADAPRQSNAATISSSTRCT